MPMLAVLTMKVLLNVNVMLGILGMDLIVLVSKIFHSIMCMKYFIPFFITNFSYLYILQILMNV
jgi:hypothetical protein